MRIWFPAIVSITSIATSVGFAAHGLSALCANLMIPALPVSAPAATPPPPEKSAASIVARHPFDSTMPAPLVTSQPGAIASPACATVTVHAIVQSNDDAWSYASLSTSEGPILARRGALVANRKVAHVGRDTVWLADADGRYCRVELYAEGVPPPPQREPAKPVPAKSSRAVDPEIARGIRKTSATSFDIDHATFERILTSTAELMGDVRVVPDNVGGNVAGMKLTKIRAGSVLTLVGLEDGDRLNAINGIDLVSPEAGLEAYARLRNAPHIVLKVARSGKEMEIQYDVR